MNFIFFILLIFLSFFLSSLAADFTIVPGVNSFTFNSSSILRHSYIYVPTQYFNHSSSLFTGALVIGLHGLGDDCSTVGTDFGFDSFSDNFGFLFLFPCALDGPIGVAWNAGTCCLENYNGTPVDDVSFLVSLVDFVVEKFKISPSAPIFLTGFSNGAMMTERLACEAPNKFRAFASVSGEVVIRPGGIIGEFECSQSFGKFGLSIPFLHIHGTSDPLVPFEGNPLLGFPPVLVDTSAWINRNRCSNSSVVTFTRGPYSNRVWSDCPFPGSVSLVTVKGGQHIWNRDQFFDTTKFIWEFFQSVVNTTKEIEELK